LKIPDGYKIPAHWHPKAENLTVIQGVFYLGTGDRLDPSKGTPLKAGDFSMMPGGMHHFAWSRGETVVQAHGMGPFQMNYVDPKDDPSKGAKTK
ncbi:MAG TPA: cupin domain-containing protein, partial [Candidatus Deferrimicrobiaceae bacterium]